jgi:hypothetical protein
MSSWGPGPRVQTEFTYEGLDAVFLENRTLRVLVLPEKGGDILEFRDKRVDVDVLWHTDHNWFPPDRRYVPSMAPTTWQDHYPGGWQVNLPIAGFGREIEGNAYGLHGESALIPWDATVGRDDDDAVSLRLTTELNRYPFVVERELTLPANGSRLEITESVTNAGEIDLEYIWQQHISFGPPLLAPGARLEIPAREGLVQNYQGSFPNARLESGAAFDWPRAPGRDGETIDLSEIPPKSVRSHDVAFARDLDDGWFTLANPDIDLGFGFRFPTDPFECIHYWQPFGGYRDSPFFCRNYNVGVEPTTAYPAISIPEAQRANGTMKSLAPGETVEATFTAATYRDVESTTPGRFDGVAPEIDEGTD